MSDFTTPYTRALNSQFKGFCPKIKVETVGSFMAVRIDDPKGEVSVLLAQDVMYAAGRLFEKDGHVESFRPHSFGYHYGGVVGNWLLK